MFQNEINKNTVLSCLSFPITYPLLWVQFLNFSINCLTITFIKLWMPFYKETVQVNPRANPCAKQLGGHLLLSPTSDTSQVPGLFHLLGISQKCWRSAFPPLESLPVLYSTIIRKWLILSLKTCRCIPILHCWPWPNRSSNSSAGSSPRDMPKSYPRSSLPLWKPISLSPRNATEQYTLRHIFTHIPWDLLPVHMVTLWCLAQKQHSLV